MRVHRKRRAYPKMNPAQFSVDEFKQTLWLRMGAWRTRTDNQLALMALATDFFTPEDLLVMAAVRDAVDAAAAHFNPIQVVR